MCELCKLGQAGTAAGSTTNEAGREARAAVGSALMTNTRVARSNKDLLDLHGITAINLMSTPHAGKTSLLESCIPTLRRDYRVGIVTSDLATEEDIRRMRALGVPTLQVVTGNGRHLDAHLLQRALEDLQDSTPHFDELRLHQSLRAVGCEAPMLGLSSLRGIGIDVFCEWLRAKEALQSLQVASRTLEAQPLPDKARLRYN